MSEATTHPTRPTPLLDTLFSLLAAHRPAFRQERPYQRCVALVLGHLAAFSRHTITQLLVALGLGMVDWSGFYRLFSTPRFDYDALSARLVSETLAAVERDTPYLVGLDGVQLPRTSQRMPGTSWLKAPRTPPWKPGIHRAQRWLHLAWLTPTAPSGYSRAIPLRVEPAFPEKARRPAGVAATKEWEAGRDALRWLRTTLDTLGRVSQWLVAVGDSVYGGADLWASLPERTVLLTRCARNRALFCLPTPPAGRGRPRRYGKRAPTPQAWLHTDGPRWQQTEVAVRGRLIGLTYRVCGPYLLKRAANQPVFLLVVRGVQRRNGAVREPTYWLVSAVRDADDRRWTLPYPPQQVLAWAWQRWELEVTHRDAKAGFGVGQAQCWNPVRAIRAVQWQWWVLSLVLLTGYRVWGLDPAPATTATRWWGGSRRWSLGQLWQALRAELWQVADFQPTWTRIVPNWWEMADWIDLQRAAVLGARRV
jgi:hypothetical protein